MASLIAKLWTKISAKKATFSIMIVGLDNSGKTSILNSLASANSRNRPITIGRHLISTDLAKKETFDETRACDKSRADDRHAGDLLDMSDDLTDKDTLTSDRSDPNNVGANILPTIGYSYERIQYRGITITVLDFSGRSKYRNLWQEFYNAVDAIVFVVDSSDLIRLVVVRDELETLLSHPYFSSLSSHQPDLQEGTQAHHLQTFDSGNLGALNFEQKQITISQGKLIQEPLDNRTAGTGVSSGSLSSNDNNNNNNNCNNNNISERIKRRLYQGEQIIRKTGWRRMRIPILFLANKTDLAHSVDTNVIVEALNLDQLARDRHPWTISATSVTLDQGLSEAFDWLVNQLLSVR